MDWGALDEESCNCDESPSHKNRDTKDYFSTSSERRVSGPGNSQLSKQTSGQACADSKLKKQPKQTGKWKKPPGMPKRPLSAYNLFFAHERKQLIACGVLASGRQKKHYTKQSTTLRRPPRKMGFAGLARAVAAKWKMIDDSTRHTFNQQAECEQAKYKIAIKQWNSQHLDLSETNVVNHVGQDRATCSEYDFSSNPLLHTPKEGQATKGKSLPIPTVYVARPGNGTVGCNVHQSEDTLPHGLQESRVVDRARSTERWYSGAQPSGFVSLPFTHEQSSTNRVCNKRATSLGQAAGVVPPRIMPPILQHDDFKMVPQSRKNRSSTQREQHIAMGRYGSAHASGSHSRSKMEPAKGFCRHDEKVESKHLIKVLSSSGSEFPTKGARSILSAKGRSFRQLIIDLDDDEVDLLRELAKNP